MDLLAVILGVKIMCLCKKKKKNFLIFLQLISQVSTDEMIRYLEFDLKYSGAIENVGSGCK